MSGTLLIHVRLRIRQQGKGSGCGSGVERVRFRWIRNQSLRSLGEPRQVGSRRYLPVALKRYEATRPAPVVFIQLLILSGGRGVHVRLNALAQLTLRPTILQGSRRYMAIDDETLKRLKRWPADL